MVTDGRAERRKGRKADEWTDGRTDRRTNSLMEKYSALKRARIISSGKRFANQEIKKWKLGNLLS